MSAEGAFYPIQSSPHNTSDAVSRTTYLGAPQLSQHDGHAYGSTAISGNAVAVLGDKHGNEHHQSNTFQITHANFLLPNVPASSSTVANVSNHEDFTRPHSENVPGCQMFQPGMNATEDNPSLWLVPFERTEAPVGRSDETDTLTKRINNTASRRRLAIAGLGGVGKSRLALEVAHLVRQQQPHRSIFWIQCSDLTSFERDCRAIAKALDMPAANDPKVDIKSVLKDLGEAVPGDWLIILDNADSEDLWSDRLTAPDSTATLLKYIPRSQDGFVLVTTRSHKIAVKIAAQNIVRLKDLAPEDASAMLKDLLVRPQLLDDPATTSLLLNRVSCLPLALVQAAAYINENDLYSIQDYLQLWDSTEEDIIELLSEDFEDSNRYAEASNAVTVTWLISFDQIRRRSMLAADILSSMACLDSHSIPRSALPIQGSQPERNKAFGMLTGYALIQPQQYDDVDLFYDMHRLVHLATRNWLRKQGSFTRWLRITAEHVYNICPWSSTRPELIHYLPHAEKLCASPEIRGEFICIKLMGKLAVYFDHTTQLAKAIELLRHILCWHELQEGPEALDTVACSLKLGWNLHCYGKIKEAQELLEPALERLDNRLDKDDLRVLRARSILPRLYLRQGRLQEAEMLAREVVETSQKVLGPANDFTINVMRTLVWVYRDQWNLEEAERLLRTIKVLVEQKYGGTDLRASKFNGDLAIILSRQGRSNEAIDLLESLMSASSTALGEKHADTLQCMFDLAIMYRNNKRLAEAERLFLKEIKIEEQLKGEDDFDLIMTKSALAKTYFAQCRYKEAGELQQCLVERGTNLHGQITPSILLIKTDLANTKWELGKQKEALSLISGCAKQSEELLGPNHKLTSDRQNMVKTWTIILDETAGDQSERVDNNVKSIPDEAPQSYTITGNGSSTTTTKAPRGITRRCSSIDAYTKKKQKLTPHLMQFPDLPMVVATGDDPP